jgi:hypothetical protein
MDQHPFSKLDQDLHSLKNLDPDQHKVGKCGFETLIARLGISFYLCSFSIINVGDCK